MTIEQPLATDNSNGRVVRYREWHCTRCQWRIFVPFYAGAMPKEVAPRMVRLHVCAT